MCKDESVDRELEKFMDKFYQKHGSLMKELEKNKQNLI